jgi:hypothetical protein
VKDLFRRNRHSTSKIPSSSTREHAVAGLPYGFPEHEELSDNENEFVTVPSNIVMIKKQRSPYKALAAYTNSPFRWFRNRSIYA